MKIFSAAQIKSADAYTIANEPVSSLQLMERAAEKCAVWLDQHFTPATPFHIFCGMGNNGGDGWVIARLLQQKGYLVTTYLLHHTTQQSADNATNQQIFKNDSPSLIKDIYEVADFPVLESPCVIIDAIFGTGLNRAIDGWVAGIIHKINDQHAGNTIIAIDIPSGMLADESSLHMPVVRAHHTLSFECYKLAFLLPENAPIAGEVHILPIGLHPDFIKQTPVRFHLTDAQMIRTIYEPRDPFANKGTYGHALLIAGSYGKMGAAVLSTQACLSAGAGLVSCYVPQCGYDIMQLSAPCAMCITDMHPQHNSHFQDVLRHPETADKYKSIGVGPGLGTETATAKALEKLLELYTHPMVIDADALNIIATYPYLLQKVPAGSILTPHPKEFERLFGATPNQFDRLALLSQKAVASQLYILLKGRYTAMACPDGAVYFNPTGNPGMATGGSGDVLTGILTGLLAHGYSSKAALILGTYLHGMAGDLAATRYSQEAMTATDIISCLGPAFLYIKGL
jgi:hydroxyethylthiazole kinase-like uncharacterized protein yjeF